MNGESRAPTKLLVDVSYMLSCFGSLSELDFWVDSWQYQGQLKLVKFWQHQAHSPRENHYLIFSNFKLKIPKIVKSPSRCDSATDHWLETDNKINKASSYHPIGFGKHWFPGWCLDGTFVCPSIWVKKRHAKIAWIKTPKDGNFRENRVKNIRNSGVWSLVNVAQKCSLHWFKILFKVLLHLTPSTSSIELYPRVFWHE